MNPYLILRLTNAAIACDKRKDFALAELLTETIKELEHGDLRGTVASCQTGTGLAATRSSGEDSDVSGTHK